MFICERLEKKLCELKNNLAHLQEKFIFLMDT